MIRIERFQRDEKGREIRPDDGWFAKAEKATQKVINAKRAAPDKKLSFNESLYRDDEVKRALSKLFSDKCAYCEQDIEGFDVEHYRPKGRVDKSSHPGYFWLAYCWENLFPSCIRCNQRRIDIGTWEDPTKGDSAGKADQFPVDGQRALAPGVQALAEKPVLVNPCVDQPEQHFSYSITGGVTGLTERGEESSKVYNLNRRTLARLRRKTVDAFLSELEVALENSSTVAELSNRFSKTYLADNAKFAGACRYVLADPDAFGLKIGVGPT